VELFPFAEYKKYVLRTIRSDETLVENYIKRVLKVYESNKIGPHKYLETYKKYADFINSKADQDVNTFLKNPDNQIEDFVFQINKHINIRNEVIQLLLTVPLNLYSLDCVGLHESLKDRIQRLKDRIVLFCIDFNRDTNKS
jgi:dynein heavy chain